MNLSALNGSDGFKISGVAVGDFLGRSVSGAGDFNGDGFDDIIIGAEGADPNGTFSGASYVVFGKASGFTANVDPSTLNGTNGFKISGVAASDSSGKSVSGAGDFNGDGFDDVVIGAPFADPNGDVSGASYVVFGRAGGFAANLNLSALNGSNGFKLSGVAAADRSGISVSGTGDVNGDGFADVLIGAFGAAQNGYQSGASYVVFGKASGFAANLNLSTLNGSNGFKMSGAAANDRAGWPVSGAGDMNGDGFADLIISTDSGAPTYVVFGRGAAVSVSDASVAEGDDDRTALQFTVSLSEAGTSR
jgi:hypothetical protein